MIKDILNFIKNNVFNLFVLVLAYQLILCIVTFTAKNFQVLLIEVIIFAILVVIEKVKSDKEK